MNRTRALLIAVIFAAIALVTWAGINERRNAAKRPANAKRGNQVTSLVSSPAAASDRQLIGLGRMAEPLTPVNDRFDRAENERLARVLRRFHARAEVEDLSQLESYVREYADSRWTPSLQANLGAMYLQTAYFNRAMSMFRGAFDGSKHASSGPVKNLADYALGEYAMMLARLGRTTQLDALIEEVADRPLTGSGAEYFRAAREGRATMALHPGSAYRCGPYAVENVARSMGLDGEVEGSQRLMSTSEGTSLDQLVAYAPKVGFDAQVAFREKGAAVLIPAVTHWKAGHFSALVDKQGSSYKSLDPTFKKDVWLSARALDEEASGYFLVEKSAKLPRGWRRASTEEVTRIRGKGAVQGLDPSVTGPNSPMQQLKCSNGRSGRGMVAASIQTQLISLNLTDTPISLSTAYGPSLDLTIVYNQREWAQPANFTFSNFGAKWAHNWTSYVEDVASAPSGTVFHFNRGGGSNEYLWQSGGFWTSDRVNGSLRRLGVAGSTSDPLRYELTYADGDKAIFANWDGATSGTRRFFLTKLIDRFENATTLEYGTGTFARRLQRVVDATGRVSLTFVYGTNPGTEFLVARVLGKGDSADTGRYADFAYSTVNGATRLTKITDPVGIESSFTYGQPTQPDFVTRIDTPEGSVSFQTGTLASDGGYTAGAFDYWFESQTAAGLKERYEFRNDVSNSSFYLTDSQLADIVVNGQLPAGTGSTSQFYYRNTFHWDPQQMQSFTGIAKGGSRPQATAADLAKASWMHWYHGRHASVNNWTASPVLQTSKRPLENWIGYQYGSSGNEFIERNTDQNIRAIGRFLPGGVPQVASWQYSTDRNVTAFVDAQCRKSISVYDSSGQLIEERQAPGVGGSPGSCSDNGQQGELLVKYEYFPAGDPMFGTGIPKRIINANGRSNTYEYDSKGRLAQVTNAEGAILRYTYHGSGSGFGKLASVRGPGSSGTEIEYKRLTYDSRGRVYQVTTNMGTVTYTFDNIDRITSILYPNGSREQASYSDPATGKQRLSMTQFTDREGQVTKFVYDADGRLSEEQQTSAGLTLTTKFQWCNCGALRKLTDPRNNATDWEYDLQGRVKRKLIAGVEVERYVYEGEADPHNEGNSRLSEIVRPNAPSVKYTYYADGRSRRTSSGTGAAERFSEYTWDRVYPRVASVNSNIGLTTYAYKSRPTSVPSPTTGNGLLQYTDGPLSGTVDRIEWTYDALDRVSTERVSGVTETLNYDALGRINSYTNLLGTFQVQFDGDTSRPLQKIFPSAAGFSSTAQHLTIDDQLQRYEVKSASATFFSMRNFSYSSDLNLASFENQVYSQDGSSVTQTLSATYRHGQLATFGSNSWNYDGAGNITSFTPATGPTRSFSFNTANQVSSAGFTYNSQGQLLSDGRRTYEWTSLGELAAVTQGNRRTEITYDAFGRFHRIRQTENSTVILDNYYVWHGDEVKGAIGTGVTPLQMTKRYFDDGFTLNGAPAYYVKDYTGTVLQVRNSGGVGNRFRAGTLAFEPYTCEFCPTGISNRSDFGFGGYFWLPTSATDGLYLTRYRAYDPYTQRFLSRDPSGESGGANLYAHGSSNWLNRIDPSGLYDKRYSPHAGIVRNRSRQYVIGCDNYDQAVRDSGQCYVIPPGCQTKRWRDLDYLYDPGRGKWSQIVPAKTDDLPLDKRLLVGTGGVDVYNTPYGTVQVRPTIRVGQATPWGHYPSAPGVKDKLVKNGAFVRPLKCALCVGDPRTGSPNLVDGSRFEELRIQQLFLQWLLGNDEGTKAAAEQGIETVSPTQVWKNYRTYIQEGGETGQPSWNWP